MKNSIEILQRSNGASDVPDIAEFAVVDRESVDLILPIQLRIIRVANRHDRGMSDPVAEPVRRLLRPLAVGIAPVQQVEGAVREIARVFIGAAIARGAHRQVESFRHARVLRMCSRKVC